MSNKRKRDTISDSEESDIFQEPKRKSSKKPREETIREKNSSDDDSNNPKVKSRVSESESSSDIESVKSDNDAHNSSREVKKKKLKSSQDSGNVKATFFSEELSSDDEIFTFQCPDNFNINTLINLEVDMDENSKIRDKNTGEFYRMKIEHHEKSITCALPNRKRAKLVTLPIKGHVVLVRNVNVPNVDLISDENENISFPNDLKVRHPLLGVDWEEHISKSNKLLNGEAVDEESDTNYKKKSSKKLKSPKKQKRSHDNDVSEMTQDRPRKKKKN